MSLTLKQLILFFAFTSPLLSQWITQNSGTYDRLASVDFIDKSNGWAVGEGGTIVRTTNSGGDWQIINTNITNNLNSVFFVDSLNGWIVGDTGTIFKTTNSGDDWFLQNSGVSLPLWDVFFVDENKGWIGTLSAGSEVLKTTNGGESWSAYPTGIVNTLTIYFTSELNGWAGGWGGDLARTTNGGITWFTQSSGTNVSRTDIFFSNSQTGWTVGGGGKITKTTDGGNSWFTLPSNNSDYFRSTYFIDDEIGWIVGDDASNTKIYKSTDGGYNWIEEFFSYNQILQDITFCDPVNGWAVGFDGLIVKYDTTKQITVTEPNGGEIFLAGTATGIQWSSNNVNVLNLLFTSNGGQNWLTIENNVLNNEYYYWNPIPNVSSDNCLIKIVDAQDSMKYDVSDSVFSIIYDPNINLLQPNGGENIYQNTVYEILWTSQFIDSVNIFYSLDDGLNWTNIISNYNYSGNRYPWTVPDTTTEYGLIKIESSINSSVFDVSEENFRIIRAPLFSYFPLAVGNRWFFSSGWDNVIKIEIEVEKDTLLNDGYYYSKLNHTYLPLSIPNTIYLRKENNKIIKYPNFLILDYEMQVGDSVFVFRPSSGYSIAWLEYITVTNVFGRILNTYYFSINELYYYTYSDGIGFNTLWADHGPNLAPELLLGCIIDGVSYGITNFENETFELTKNYLLQNHPNPFNPSTIIKYSVNNTQRVTLQVYDLLGREIATLVNEEKPLGEYEVDFDGAGLPSGIYFYQLIAGEYIETKKMVLMR